MRYAAEIRLVVTIDGDDDGVARDTLAMVVVAATERCRSLPGFVLLEPRLLRTAPQGYSPFMGGPVNSPPPPGARDVGITAAHAPQKHKSAGMPASGDALLVGESPPADSRPKLHIVPPSQCRPPAGSS